MNKTKFFSSLLVGLLVTTGLFTSCKDYDDDIKNLQAQIDQKSPITALNELKTSLEAKLATLESTLNTKEAALKAELDKKADKTALDAEIAARVKAIADLTAEIDGIKTKLAAIEVTLGTKADQSALDALKLDVDKKADQSALQKAYDDLLAKIAENAQGDQADEQALQTAIATLTGKIDERLTEAQVKAIVDESAAAQTLALQALKSEIEGKLESLGLTKADIEKLIDVNNKIAAIEDALKAFTGAETIEEAKEKMQELAQKINKNLASINILEAFVQKQLTSLVLKPAFYWEGLEGIEVPCGSSPIFKVNAEDYKFKYTVPGAQGDQEIEVTVKGHMDFAATIYNKKDVAKGTYLLNSEVEVGGDDYGFWDTNLNGVAGPDNLTQYMARTRLNNLLQDNKIKGAKASDGDYVSPTMAELMQGGIATYHYNPSTADLEGYKISFFENDAEVYTRSARTDSILATPYETTINKASNQYNTYENGILTIPFKVDAQTLGNMFFNWAYQSKTQNPSWDFGQHDNPANGYNGEIENQLPFIAAQLSKTGEKGDTIVTSDYGVVVPAMIQIIALADNDPLAMINGKSTEFAKEHNSVIRANHLYESVGYNGVEFGEQYDNYGAITMPATHEIVYTEKAFNLEKYIETHVRYTNFARYGRSDAEDRLMTDAEMAALGLHYEYTLVDYMVGNETTSQTKHLIRVDKDGNPSSDEKVGYFSVRSVDDQGETMVNEKATQETIGREPLIRVTLVDQKGNIVRYGYIKLRITQSAAVNEYVKINMGEMYMNCGEEKKVTWAQMENILLRKLDMTKQDFEKNYYLDVVEGYEYMPHINPGTGETAGPLYTVGWQAKRFYAKDEDKKQFDEVPGLNYDEFAPADYAKLTKAYKADGSGYGWNNAINKFGRVWYTPHDNSTNTHNWDENTNVLVWNLMNFDAANPYTNASNMTPEAYYKMIEIVKATYNNQGTSQNEFSTVVRFVNKNNGTFVYVKLYFETEKIHFAYGDINNRVLDHWYDFADGYKDNTADTIEVYANVPTPALNTTPALDVNSFKKDLKEFWLDSKVVPLIHNLAKFDKFQDLKPEMLPDTIQSHFMFRLPVKGASTSEQDAEGRWVNSSTVQFKTGKIKIQGTDKDKAQYWEVKGASGATYQLYLAVGGETTLGNYSGELGNQIVAVKQGKMENDEIIATITDKGVIKYMGYTETTPYTKENTKDQLYVNSAATDILNYVGMYDATGKLIKDSYLDGQDGTDNKGFTAFVEINVTSEACYDPLMGRNCFNVRFLRPVNMWPAKTEWTDAPNDTQIYPLWKLVYIRDWRQFPVVPLDKEQKFGEAAKAGTGEDGKTYKGQIKGGTDGIVTYEFYNITNLYVKRDDIRSDAYLEPSKRTILTDPAKIAELLTIDHIPALTGTNAETQAKWEYLKIFKWDTDEATTKTKAGSTATGEEESTKWDNVLAYTNNSGVVKEFHIYVPVSLKYPWGSVTDWTQKVWAVITVKPTTGNE